MPPSKKTILVLLLIVLLIVLLRTAWIGDDSYITIRTIDNFINGYGLTWNPAERVQTYTHPLWMMILLVVYSLTRHAYGTLLFSSIFFSVAAVITVLSRENDEFVIFLGWCMLVLSNAFIDYSTSGLENPASYLVLAAFGVIYLGTREKLTNKHLITIGVLMGLAVLNRIDLLWLVLPPLAEIVLRKEGQVNTWLVAIGFLPILLWEIFSIIYYGFPFPNTYYAKLQTGIAARALMKQGTLYFFNSLAWDPITLTLIGATLILTIIRGNRRQKMIALGIALYLGYILKIGGDFMSGRFFSVPYFLSVVLIVQLLREINLRTKLITLLAVALLGTMARTPSYSAPTSRDDPLENLTGVSDEQAYYYGETGLLRWGKDSELPQSKWVDQGRQLKQDNTKVFVGKGIGFLGYNAGPGVHVIDYFALSDPFLSHLPVYSKDSFLIGHFGRLIPKGYLESLESGENQVKDPSLAGYYDKIRVITRGPIWDRQRWEYIWKLNTGQFDFLLVNYYHTSW